MTTRTDHSGWWRTLPAAVPGITLCTLLVHLWVGAHDNLFRDELYYLACADHLDWGYVDHPPLSIAVLWLWRAVLGDSLLAIRLLPALLDVVLVVAGARLAARFGGGGFAQTLAALCVAITPQYLGITGYYSMNAFDLCAWALLALLVARCCSDDTARPWLWFGLVAGLGLQNKVSVLFFCAGFAVAIVLTPLRRQLRQPQLWLGALLALSLFAPHVLWQWQHGWPTAEFIANATRDKNVGLSPWQFLLAQIGEIHPFNLPIWLVGLGALLWGRLRRFRALGIVYLVAFGVMALQNSKPYYLGPAYPMLLAAGAVVLEQVVRHTAVRGALVALLVLGGCLAAPFAMPLLAPATFVAYAQALGEAPVAHEKQALGPLPQFFADRQGWQELVAQVAAAYHALPPEERARTLIFASNYGEAAAIDHYGPALGLPRASAGHNNYFLWGPTIPDPAVVLTVGISEEGMRRSCEQVSVVGRFSHPFAMPYEQREPLLACRGLRLPLPEAWQRGKKFI